MIMTNEQTVILLESIKYNIETASNEFTRRMNKRGIDLMGDDEVLSGPIAGLNAMINQLKSKTKMPVEKNNLEM